MGIFRNRPMVRHQQQPQVYRPQAVQTPPPAVPVTPPPPPVAAAPVIPEKSAPPASNSLLQGLGNNFGGMFKQLQQATEGNGLGELLKARQGVQLSPEERAQVQQAAGVMQRLAGADGMWNRGDLNNNVRQLESSGDLRKAVNQEIGKRWGQELSQRGMLGKALVNGHMRRNMDNYQQKGMQQARGMAKDQMNQGMDKAAVRGGAGHDDKKTTAEGLKKSGEPISRAEMEKFQKTMDMLQEKSKAQGLPEVKFPNGVPAQFLKDVADGKSPQKALQDAGAVLQLKSGQTVDLSKFNQTNPKAEAAIKEVAPKAEAAVKEAAQEVKPPAPEQTDQPKSEAPAEVPEPEAASQETSGPEPEPEPESPPEEPAPVTPPTE